MATWRQFSDEAPELATQVLERFAAHQHKTMATLRADGAPRISGSEVPILGDQMYLGGMSGNRRFADLRRDPRVAIHSASDDPEVWSGDAKVSGTAIELLGQTAHDAFRAASAAAGSEVPPEAFELFRIELVEAVVVRLSAEKDHLLIQTWREGLGVTTLQRR